MVCGVIVVVIEILAVDRLAGQRQITEQDGDDQHAVAGKSKSS